MRLKTALKKIDKSLRLKRNEQIFRFFAILVIIVLFVLIWKNRESLKELAGLGYIGIFIINFVSNATVIFPVPGAATVFLGGAVWNPIIVGFISGLGAALGELFGYFLGYGGRGALHTVEKKNSWIKKLETRYRDSGFMITFFFSALPIPVFDFIGILAGAMNYPVWKFFTAALLGRVLRNIIFAWSGEKILQG